MFQVHIRDRNIFSDRYPDRPNPYFKWVYDRQSQNNDITVFTEGFFSEAFNNKSKIKVAWLLEPPSIAPLAYKFIHENHKAFDCIFTYIDELVNRYKQCVWVPYGTTWIYEDQRKIYEKSKLSSMVASKKNQTEGHKLRHEIIKKFGDRLSVMGRGYKIIEQKLEAHKDYRYSVIVENGRYNSYFSEKLLDCFMTGSVPIYWGFSRVKDIFNSRGVLTFNSLTELGTILKSISEEDYCLRKGAIKENFQRAQKYLEFESYMFNSFFSKIQ